MKNNKVYILGEIYTVSIVDSMDIYMQERCLCGYCDYIRKRIVVLKNKIDSDETLRHEIVHAFMYESGLDQYRKDEVLVEWVAQMLPRINEAIKKARRK